MTTTEFCYWLQGSLEINDNSSFSIKQTAVLKKHLDMVFTHIAHLADKDQPPVISTFTGYKPGERC